MVPPLQSHTAFVVALPHRPLALVKNSEKWVQVPAAAPGQPPPTKQNKNTNGLHGLGGPRMEGVGLLIRQLETFALPAWSSARTKPSPPVKKTKRERGGGGHFGPAVATPLREAQKLCGSRGGKILQVSANKLKSKDGSCAHGGRIQMFREAGKCLSSVAKNLQTPADL